MYPTILVTNIFQKIMSRKITTFFNPVVIGTKRKHEAVEQEDNNDDSAVRFEIAKLAKTVPALSNNIGKTWFSALQNEFSTEYFKKLSAFLVKQRSQHTIYPPVNLVYSWTLATPIYETKVVILGQDPYHGPNQAHGLAFSVCKGVAIPPSLRNMYVELEKDIDGFKIPSHGYLHGWASQGVLLLNACLTVKASCADSHKGEGWEQLTDAVIKYIGNNLSNVVFMLWGKNAQSKAKLISKEHLILTAPHPSPLSAHRGFFGCKHFSKANTYLKEHRKKPVNWAYLP